MAHCQQIPDVHANTCFFCKTHQTSLRLGNEMHSERVRSELGKKLLKPLLLILGKVRRNYRTDLHFHGRIRCGIYPLAQYGISEHGTCPSSKCVPAPAKYATSWHGGIAPGIWLNLTGGRGTATSGSGSCFYRASGITPGRLVALAGRTCRHPGHLAYTCLPRLTRGSP
jgi:hypothetical protein